MWSSIFGAFFRDRYAYLEYHRLASEEESYAGAGSGGGHLVGDMDVDQVRLYCPAWKCVSRAIVPHFQARQPSPHMDAHQVRPRWPAWKCVVNVVVLSHPGTPTPLHVVVRKVRVGPPGRS